MRAVCSACVNRDVCRGVCTALESLLAHAGLDMERGKSTGVVPYNRRVRVLQARLQELSHLEKLLNRYEHHLSRHQRRVARLYWSARLTITEIAQHLNRNRSTISRTLTRARLTLLTVHRHEDAVSS